MRFAMLSAAYPLLARGRTIEGAHLADGWQKSARVDLCADRRQPRELSTRRRHPIFRHPELVRHICPSGK